MASLFPMAWFTHLKFLTPEAYALLVYDERSDPLSYQSGIQRPVLFFDFLMKDQLPSIIIIGIRSTT